MTDPERPFLKYVLLVLLPVFYILAMSAGPEPSAQMNVAAPLPQVSGYSLQAVDHYRYEQKADTLGRELYRSHCASCHGEDLSGFPRAGYPPLTGIEERMSVDEQRSVIVEGRAFMPGFGDLDEKEVDAILRYLEDRKSSEPSEESGDNR